MTGRREADHKQGPDVGGLEWNSVLGHELRSPIAAILGYQELMEEGTFGDLPDAALESVRRIGLSARQLLLLVEAIDAGNDPDLLEEPALAGAAELAHDSIRFVRHDADARGITIRFEGDDVELRTRVLDARRAVILALTAAVKVSPDVTLTVSAQHRDLPQIRIAGSLLDPRRDAIEHGVTLTGAALRLELARSAARRAEGSVELDANGTITISLPALPVQLPIDEAEHLP